MMKRTHLFFFIITIVSLAELVRAEELSFELKSIFLYDHTETSLWRNDLNQRSRSDEDDEIPVISGTLQFLADGARRRSRSEEDGDGGWFSNGPIPDWTDRGTVLLFAELSSNAYLPRGASGWYPVPGFGEAEYAEPFGWDFDNHLRGYVFSSTSGQVVIAIKGTDLPWNSDTSSNDISQDWLMFSCCGEGRSAQNGCGCDSPSNNTFSERVCNVPCMMDCIATRSHQYYNAALDIFDTVKLEYPSADYFITGHSLGAALASVLASTVLYPAVGFESPPERGYLWLSGDFWSDDELPYLPIFHFGSEGDPIFVGNNQCTTCAMGGAPIMTKCHLGYRCAWPSTSVIDTVRNHMISSVIQLLQSTTPLPECFPDTNCLDCESWDWQLE